ncbi:uncharacterized protein LOC122132932 isoform X2 [Clupea harengus]|uniref:Uncharacterized protein LOC122132932 isoform X2 n=1 Tax=Clupea harengus TaxID=7950 RepID=A0A8M1KIY5_CLUHA|nr:uncharacterized protein LOC122132932 isoform X2 [Clupea harengus]
MSDDEGAAAPGVVNNMMVPWFLGGPWVPKYGDKGSQQPFIEWRDQIEVYLRAQTLSAEQRVDFVMSALQGDARREILLLQATERNTDSKIFTALERLYGDVLTTSQVRAKFFKCQQLVGEGVGPFILRLRESHFRWRSREEATGSDVEMLRSQLVLGLLPGPVQTELQRRVRREPDLTFKEACKEVKAMEKETERATVDGVDIRRTYNNPPQPTPPAPSDPLQNWDSLKEALRTELAGELRAQVIDLKTSLLAELRSQQTTRQQPEQPPSKRGGEQGANRAQRRPRLPQWDDQGRPICLRCGQAGHMLRECQNRESTNHFRVTDEGRPVEVPMRSALVGESPEVEVLVQGKRIPCILDTGSQVTLFSQGLFQKHLQGTEMKEVGDIPWLTLKAANGLALPYVGYTVLDFEVGGVLVLGRGVVIVEDKYLPPAYGVLGMNVIQHCWDGLRQQGGRTFTMFKSTLPRSAGVAWDRAFAACRRLEAEEHRGPSLGVARLRTSDPVWLAPQTETAVWAHVPEAPKASQEDVLLEDCYHGGQEWCVGRAVARLQDGRVLLRICNPHPYPVALPPRRPLARVLRLGQDDVQTPNQLVLRQEDDAVVEVDVRPVSSPLSPCMTSLLQQTDGLTPPQSQQLQGLLERWQGVFAQSEDDYGCTNAVYHTIPTGGAAPIRQRYRPVPPNLYAELRTLLRDMLDGGVVRESSSPWAAPVVLVKKKDGSWRFCVDYRKLNAVTHKDAYPLPRVEESLTNLKKAEWYSTLDLASGYWQVEVHPTDREKTAFATPLGLYEFERMPFGLCNAPATFQRLMQRCLGGQVHDFLLIYLDDIILYSPDFHSHIGHLEQVFSKLQDHGLKLQPTKCHLFQRSVQYLGHVVSQGGVATDPQKTEAVQDWPVPTTVREVRSFLGFVGYYRRFVPSFARKAGPLHALLRGTGGSKTKLVDWTPECGKAFEDLKEALLRAPVLAYADFGLPFRVYTDASLHGLGAVLAQVQEGRERVIAYASRGLHDAERNDQHYSAFKLELLALKWAVTEKFKDYLWGATFKIFTDHRPLLHLQTANLGAVEQRWAAQLANFDFSLCHKPGADHQNADALSRLPEVTAARRLEAPEPEPEGLEQGSWAERQGSDLELAKIRQWRQQGNRPTPGERQSLQASGRRLVGEWERLNVQDGVLVWRRPALRGQEGGVAIVAPVAERKTLWTQYHVALGHAKGSRLLTALRERLFWIGMSRDNHRFAFAVPTRDQTAATTVAVLWGTVFRSFGCPERILTDQGPAFEADLTQQLCTLYGCRKVRTTPYHPQGNGACERMNQTILSLLNTLEPREYSRWREHLPGLVHAYNNTPHSVTGLAPFFVVFGRHARLPVDQLAGLERPEQRGPLQDWVQQHHARLQNAYQLVKERNQHRQQQDQGRRNQGPKAQPLLPGERVFVRDFRRRARGKLGYHWDPRPYVVRSQPTRDRPVYVIRPEGREGPLRTLHQNNLCVQPSSWRSGAHGGVGELAGSQPTVPPEAERGPERGWWPVCFPCEQGRPEPRENLRGAREVGEALAEAGVESGDPLGPRRSQRANLGVRPASMQGENVVAIIVD